MKKYKAMGLLFLLIYVILAGVCFFLSKPLEQKRGRYYLVESNRICEKLKQVPEKEILKKGKELCKGTGIRQIAFLPVTVTQKVPVTEFYEMNTKDEQVFYPLYQKQKLVGYLRFRYQSPNLIHKYAWQVQGILLVWFLILAAAWVYAYKNIIKPFAQLQQLPYHLSQGDFTATVKESKNRYFGHFLWGIGMLKDNLDYHRKQEWKLARDKKMLILSISHDIKTPVNAIHLYATALEKGIYKTREEQLEAALHIKEKVKEIDGYVKDIVESSTKEVVSITVHQGEFYLAELVEKIRIAYTEKCAIHKIDFTIGAYADCLIAGDLDRIFEAACNILENAMKYGDGKCISITFSEEEYYQLLSIYNSGETVAEKDCVHIFDSFFRGSNATGKPGNGLGLYICQEIMTKCGGDIYAKGREDGMEFVLVMQPSAI